MTQLNIDYAIALPEGQAPIGLFHNIPSFFICEYVYVRFEDFYIGTEYIRYYGMYSKNSCREAVERTMGELYDSSLEYFIRTGRQNRAFCLENWKAVMLFPYSNAQMTGCNPNTATFETLRWKETHAPRRSAFTPLEQSSYPRLV